MHGRHLDVRVDLDFPFPADLNDDQAAATSLSKTAIRSIRSQSQDYTTSTAVRLQTTPKWWKEITCLFSPFPHPNATFAKRPDLDPSWDSRNETSSCPLKEQKKRQDVNPHQQRLPTTCRKYMYCCLIRTENQNTPRIYLQCTGTPDELI
jgi:hypothetical protein